MGIFQKVTGWLTDKSDRFIRGGAGHEGGYYATPEARQAYGSLGGDQAVAESDQAGEQTDRKPALDPFGRGEGEYGGRTPYRSKYDLEMEAYQQAQQAAMQQTSRMQPQQAAPQGAQQPGMAQQAPVQQPMMPPQAGQRQAAPMQQSAQYPQGYAPPANNVVPFPGMQRGPDGMVYAHVEYIVLLRSRNECKDVIGYIKTSASVFLNMEFIASDSERQRCVDMLSGAAYTLGCALNKISPRGIYLISAPTVKVVLDPAMQKFAAAPEAQGYARQRYEQEGYQQGYTAAPAAPAYEQPMQAAASFSQESPTARFQAQGTQRSRPISFSSAMAGNRSASFAPVGGMGQSGTARYAAGDYAQ